jgi:hypothetical protein
MFYFSRVLTAALQTGYLNSLVVFDPASVQETASRRYACRHGGLSEAANRRHHIKKHTSSIFICVYDKPDGIVDVTRWDEKVDPRSRMALS